MKFWIKENKFIAAIVIAIIIVISSVALYISNSNKVMRDEYMKDIFVEEPVATVNNNEENKNISTNSKNNNIAVDKKDIVVDIKGMIKNPGVYYIKDGSIVQDLIEKAGGLTEEADISSLNRAEKLKDNQELIVPNIKDKTTTTAASDKKATGITSDGLININLATLEELNQIKGVGETKAKAIMEYREKNGGFKAIEEIKNISGIGDKTFEGLKNQITI